MNNDFWKYPTDPQKIADMELTSELLMGNACYVGNRFAAVDPALDSDKTAVAVMDLEAKTLTNLPQSTSLLDLHKSTFKMFCKNWPYDVKRFTFYKKPTRSIIKLKTAKARKRKVGRKGTVRISLSCRQLAQGFGLPYFGTVTGRIASSLPAVWDIGPNGKPRRFSNDKTTY